MKLKCECGWEGYLSEATMGILVWHNILQATFTCNKCGKMSSVSLPAKEVGPSETKVEAPSEGPSV